MIFVGDIALPYKGAVQLQGLPTALKTRNWFGNLEGAVVDGSEKVRYQRVVFNDKKAIKALTGDINFIGFGLANNHIFDTGSYEETVGFLEDQRLLHCGIGKDLRTAQKPLIFRENGEEIVILNFGWEIIQCEITNGKEAGVNPLTKAHVLETVADAIRQYPAAHIVPFMHWSYELEAEPQPLERELAKKLIDMGVAGVIGCHPHRIGGYERYKDKPIIYSLGNWMFRQNYYHRGKLQFPDFCNAELAVEWDFGTHDLKFHFFDFNKSDLMLRYNRTESKDSATMSRYTPFRGLSDHDYKSWYKKNHYHKNKGLPIYYWEDSQTKVFLKNKLNAGRDILVRQLARLR